MSSILSALMKPPIKKRPFRTPVKPTNVNGIVSRDGSDGTRVRHLLA